MNAIGAQAGATAVRFPLLAAKLTLAFAVAFVALLTLVHLVTPELDPGMRPISEYALGPRGWLMTLAFLAWGASTATVAAALRPHVSTRAGRIGLVFLLIGAAGSVLASLFPMDPISTATEAITTSGQIHNLSAMLGDAIPIGALLATISLVRRNPAWRAATRALVATTLLAWTGVVVMTAMLVSHVASTGGQFGPNSAIGWPARLMVLAYVSWSVVAARFAIRLEHRGGTVEP